MRTLRNTIGITAAVLALTAAAVVMGSSDRSSSARAAGPVDLPAPTFRALAANAAAAVPQAARDALDRAGAPANAPAFAVDKGDSLVIVVPGAQTYLGLYDKATKRSAIVATPPEVLKKHAGTWVSSGGAGMDTELALLVPDGVDSATLTEEGGRTTSVPVRDNIALVSAAGRFDVSYELAGASHVARVEEAPQQG